MKYLVTGGAGFIGSHLIELLINKNHQVVCIDDLSTGYKVNLSTVMQKIDLYEEKIEFFDYAKLTNIDAIIHLAAQPSVPLSISNFSESSCSNIFGTIKIIDYARSNNLPLVYASSSAVYGNLKLGDDEADTYDLLSPYATDKYAMELYSKMAYQTFSLSSVGLRFFNVYGPRQDPSSAYSGVISIFADQLTQGKDIVINGGHQTRDFIYVKDIVNIIYRALEISSSDIICEISNVLTGQSISIEDLAKKMMKIIDIKAHINYKSLPSGDPAQSDGSINKMAKLFSVDSSKFTTLNNGLLDTINYIANER